MAKAKAKKRAAKKAAPSNGALAAGQRIKVSDGASWANGYAGAVVGESSGGTVVVQLDVKGVSHEFKRDQLVAI